MTQSLYQELKQKNTKTNKQDPPKSPMETNVNYQCHIHPWRQILVINVTFMSLITKQHLPPPPQPFSLFFCLLDFEKKTSEIK